MKRDAGLQVKPAVWIGGSRKDLASFPDDVKDSMGYALYLAQRDGKHPDAKPLKGFGGGRVLEIVADDSGDTYRLIYTVRLPGRIYVLHAFQKKSKTGIKTPARAVQLIRSRLRGAEEEHARWIKEGEQGA